MPALVLALVVVVVFGVVPEACGWCCHRCRSCLVALVVRVVSVLVVYAVAVVMLVVIVAVGGGRSSQARAFRRQVLQSVRGG